MPNSPERPVITTDQVRRQMLGLSTILASVDPTALTDLLNDAIGSAQNRFERELETYFGRRVLVTRPSPDMVIGRDYDIQADPYDFHANEFRFMGSFTTRKRPIISVQRIAVEYGFQPNQVFLLYPNSWIQLEHTLGKIMLIPVEGSALPASLGVAPTDMWWLPQLMGSVMGGILPDLVSIDYTCGLEDVDSDPVYHELRMALAKQAALMAFPSLMAMIPTSMSRDGVSVGFGLIGNLEKRYETDVAQFISEWNSERTAFHLAVA